MQLYENQSFVGFIDRASKPWQKGRVFQDREFRNCRFESCAISLTRDPRRRSVVRNLRLINCEAAVTVYTAVIEEVLVDGLETTRLLQTWAAVYQHVTFRGRIGRLMFSPAVALGRARPEEQRAFDEANAAYYAGVDWALDITEAECEEL